MSSRPASIRSAFGTIARLRLPMLLALVALFSLATLGSWHDMHPDLPVTLATAATTVQADHPATGDPDFLDHVAAHAGLHAIGLPAAHAAAFAPVLPATIWHSADLPVMASIVPLQALRPPRR